MKKLVVKTKEWYCNIPADHLEESEGMVRAYLCGNLVGVFDLGVIDVIYLSVKDGGSND